MGEKKYWGDTEMAKWMSRGGWVCLCWVLVMAVPPGPASAQEFEYVSPEQLQRWMEKGDPGILVVDTQPRKAYEKGHIRGAVNFPWAMDLQNPGNLPRDKTLILYCDCPEEEDSIDVARQLKEKWSYEKIKLLRGGWSRWRKLGYPVDKS
jgi:rhodanese-related sulfurtransferase